MPDLRININGRNDNNMIIEREYPEFDGVSVRLKSMGGLRASQNVKVLFRPTAVKSLFEDIGWGKRYRCEEEVEQAGILIGNYYCDRVSGEEIVWGDVVTVIPADKEMVNASFEAVGITAAAWQKMYEEANGYQVQGFQILGWYHTHLGCINARFSRIDEDTQRSAFTYNLNCSNF